MGTERHPWSKADIRTAADVAKEKGVTVKLERDGSIIVSSASATDGWTIEGGPESEGYAPVQPASRARSTPSVRTATANSHKRRSLSQLREEDPDEWQRQLVKQPLGKREASILLDLDSNGVDGRMEADTCPHQDTRPYGGYSFEERLTVARAKRALWKSTRYGLRMLGWPQLLN